MGSQQGRNSWAVGASQTLLLFYPPLGITNAEESESQSHFKRSHHDTIESLVNGTSFIMATCDVTL